MSLGAKLTKLREGKGESLQQTADAVGISKGHLWQVERGKADKPSIAAVQALASHFGVTVGYLLGEKLDADDVDPEMAAMFRDAAALSDDDREILTSTMRTLLDRAKRRKDEG